MTGQANQVAEGLPSNSGDGSTAYRVPLMMAFEVPQGLGDDMMLMAVWSGAIRAFPDIKRFEFEAALRWFNSYAESHLGRMSQ